MVRRVAPLWVCLHLALLMRTASPLVILVRPHLAGPTRRGLPSQSTYFDGCRQCRTNKARSRPCRLLAEEEEEEEQEQQDGPPDADLASAWLDDEEAGVLSDADVAEVAPAEALTLSRFGRHAARLAHA